MTDRPTGRPGTDSEARVVDPVVRTLLRSPAHRLLIGSVLMLEAPDTVQVNRHALPVMYAAPARTSS